MSLHILLTNDDGIYAEGIYALYQELIKIGKVTVVAPESERSSVGHGITLSHPIWYKKCYRKNKLFGYAISGTPADCVKFAANVIIKKKPDFVVSGINLGPNDGCSVFYSGTVAGAREGALMGIPSMAVSLNTFVKPRFQFAARCAAKLVKNIAKASMPKGTFLNVNVPHVRSAQVKGLQVTQQGTVPIHGLFKKRVDPNLREYYWMTGRMPYSRKDKYIDSFALNHHFVTITPIKCDSTDFEYLNTLQNMKF